MAEEKQEKYMRLYAPVAGRLSAFCFAKTRNREEAKEMASETILASYENLESLKNESAFLSFLFSIASNIYKASYKRSKRLVLSQPGDFDEMFDSAILPDDATDIRLLFEAMDKLPVNQKEAI